MKSGVLFGIDKHTYINAYSCGNRIKAPRDVKARIWEYVILHGKEDIADVV